MDTTLSCRLQRYTVSKLVTTSDIYKNIFSALGYADISGYLTRTEFLVLKVKKKHFVSRVVRKQITNMVFKFSNVIPNSNYSKNKVCSNS